jgi:hypothetical protein
VICYCVNEGFLSLSSEKIVRFSSFKKHSARCLRQRGRGIKGQKRFLQNRFYPLKIPLINKST